MLIICYSPSHKFTETIQGGSKVDVKEKGVFFPLSDQITASSTLLFIAYIMNAATTQQRCYDLQPL